MEERHELSAANDVSFHSVSQRSGSRSRGETRGVVKRVQLEEIAVPLAWRRTSRSVAVRPEVVVSLPTVGGDLPPVGEAGLGWNRVEHPMDESGRVWILHDERPALRSRRSAFPVQRRRYALPLATEIQWQGIPVLKSYTFQGQGDRRRRAGQLDRPWRGLEPERRPCATTLPIGPPSVQETASARWRKPDRRTERNDRRKSG